MFRTIMCPSSGEITEFMWHFVLVIPCGWVSGMQDGKKLSYFSWWWVHSRPKHVAKRNKHTKKHCAPSLCLLDLRHCDSDIRVAGWSCASACYTDTTPTQPHRNSNTHGTKNNTTNVVIQKNSRKLLMMDILMSETCWAHKKWNKIASDIKLVFYSCAPRWLYLQHYIGLRGQQNIKLCLRPSVIFR